MVTPSVDGFGNDWSGPRLGIEYPIELLCPIGITPLSLRPMGVSALEFCRHSPVSPWQGGGGEGEQRTVGGWSGYKHPEPGTPEGLGKFQSDTQAFWILSAPWGTEARAKSFQG
jgi:hypothetical protein